MPTRFSKNTRYLPGAHEQPRSAQPQEDALCVSLGGLSKSAGLPQMKTGWMVLTGPAAAVEELRERLLLVADTYLSVSTPVQAALPRLLNLGRTIGDAIRQRTRANLEFLRKSAAAAPHLTLLSTGGGWNAVLRLPSFRTDAEWSASLLNETGVLAQPGYLYDFEGEAWLVLSLLSNDAVFEEGVLRLGAHVEEATRQAHV
ncbi:MAG: aminotransferase class I/II-fold pyridoxal phosphate-dependent enzyme [Bryobacterales bacterium]|nr:aminotransferase class I/II-fold pyridoxal phosphate-dependent enzyme [Bryobacterales bacterium]